MDTNLAAQTELLRQAHTRLDQTRMFLETEILPALRDSASSPEAWELVQTATDRLAHDIVPLVDLQSAYRQSRLGTSQTTTVKTSSGLYEIVYGLSPTEDCPEQHFWTLVAVDGDDGEVIARGFALSEELAMAEAMEAINAQSS